MGDVGVTLAERRPRHRGHAVHKLGLKQDVGVCEHAVFEGHDHELQEESWKMSDGSLTGTTFKIIHLQANSL